ncbi:hypothetical protein E2562_037413 [Oryza meyeriana var. granulata]|uniref:Uncharacterized protein n=1 Tax=Oryza meyeriana var. granulata TaxID=110450 RepID=A0A6G1EEZ6_9ORYZ|nr:hypothetical protein E2562_037413 [Oryza meyeriana var. granulata]
MAEGAEDEDRAATKAHRLSHDSEEDGGGIWSYGEIGEPHEESTKLDSAPLKWADLEEYTPIR